jgi:GNAT superfamily N-acetyltransferase
VVTQFHLDLTEPVDPAGRADHVSPPAPRVSAATPANGTHTGSILGHAVPGASVAAARAVPPGLTAHERFPALTISTPRLHVRPLTLADAGPVTDVFADRLTQRWLPVSAESGPIDGRTWCGDAAEERRAMGEGDHYGIVRREDDQLIGCLWTKRTDWSAHATEISFALAPHARGFGVALSTAERWIRERRATWERRLDRLGDVLAEQPD